MLNAIYHNNKINVYLLLPFHSDMLACTPLALQFPSFHSFGRSSVHSFIQHLFVCFFVRSVGRSLYLYSIQWLDIVFCIIIWHVNSGIFSTHMHARQHTHISQKNWPIKLCCLLFVRFLFLCWYTICKRNNAQNWSRIHMIHTEMDRQTTMGQFTTKHIL